MSETAQSLSLERKIKMHEARESIIERLALDLPTTINLDRFLRVIVSELGRMMNDLRELQGAIKKQQGVLIGRPRSVPDDTAHRIRRLRQRGLSLRTIGAQLDAGGVPTGHGARRWSAESVRGVLARSKSSTPARIRSGEPRA